VLEGNREKNPIHNNLKMYEGINLGMEVNDSYNENCKTLKKESEENTGRKNTSMDQKSIL
jgi:hypothetical protein